MGGRRVKALVDNGAEDNVICPAQKLNLKVEKTGGYLPIGGLLMLSFQGHLNVSSLKWMLGVSSSTGSGYQGSPWCQYQSRCSVAVTCSIPIR